MALFDVIAHDNVNDCKYILERDSSLVNSVGWHGMTPLHRAATRGNLEILEVLLSYGAKVNAVNGFGETPLHFACQTASLRFIGVLVENGADIQLVDNGGRSCLHHAARSGSVWKIHYFVECGLDLSRPDMRGQTVLHIAAECGHADLLQYCLRNRRFDPGITDNSMMTPLHYAVLSKNRQCAWLIESSSPKSLVFLPDIHGNAPVDYADQGKTIEHKWLKTHLKYWNASRFAGYQPKPWLPWLLLLLAPSILICLMVYCIKVYAQAGWVLSIMMCAAFYAWALTSHRIRHVSKIPNPAFAGLFFGVILQSLICYAVELAPHLWPELFWNTTAVFVFVTLIWEIKKLYGDPGRIATSRLKEDGHPYTIKDIANGLIPTEDFCTDCEIITQPFSKHCKLCNHCVIAIDHHCLFLMCCVALNNHRHFVIFMLQILVSQFLFVRASYTYLYSLVKTNGEFPSTFRDAMGQQVYVSALLVLNCIGFLWVLMLTLFQFKVVSEGGTTFYTPEGAQKYTMSFREMYSCGHVSCITRIRNFILFILGDYSFYKNRQRSDQLI